jgi:hypothetical protein
MPTAIYKIGTDGKAITEPITTSFSIDGAPVIIEFAP